MNNQRSRSNKTAKLIGILLLCYALITALAVLNIQLDWVVTLKQTAVLLHSTWGQGFGLVEVGSGVLGIALAIV